MKKTFLMIVAFVTTMASALANDGGLSDYKIRNWTATQEFKSISVSGDVSIVLMEETSSVLSVQGKQKFVDAVKMEIKNGVLHVSGKRGPWKNKTVVYIPVQHLKLLTVKGNSEVVSMGLLNSPSLHVRIEGSCTVSVKNRGLVTVDNDDYHTFSFDKNEKIKVLTGGSL